MAQPINFYPMKQIPILIRAFAPSRLRAFAPSRLRAFALACALPLVSWAQQTVSGTVTDDNGLPLPGATVVVQNTNRGTTTDFDGKYQIQAIQGETLTFSYVGYASQNISVGSNATINVQMEPTGLLEEVVITAYGTTTKEAFTGSAGLIGSDEISLRSATSPIGVLEGNTTGLQIINDSGAPGASPGIVIRGVGTLNGSTEPLYVIDGVQFEGSLASLNQDDIQSMTVLKDAASTALYGSRAANGVVIITTKKGIKRTVVDGDTTFPIQVNVSSQHGLITKGIREYEMLNPGEYYEMMWEAYKNTLGDLENPEAEASATIFNRLGYNPFDVEDTEIVRTDGTLNPDADVIYKSLNWYDLLERTGQRTNHSINVSGGSQNHQVYFSASYLDEQGYVIESSLERITSRLNADFDTTKWLTIGGSVNLATRDILGVSGAGSNSIVNPFGFARNLGSIYPVYVVDNDGEVVLDEAGKPVYDFGEGHPDFGIQSRPYSPGRHAIAEAILNEDLDRNNDLGFRLYSSFNITDDLKITFNYAQDIQDGINKRYENNIVGDGAPTGRYRETRFRRVVENFNQIVNFDKSFSDLHNFDLTLGHESFDRNYSQNFALANTQTAEGIFEFDNFSVISSLGGYTSDKRVEGYFGRLNYNYNNKYFLSTSARRDGSSVFNSDVRWGNFYSVGGAWLIEKEGFMQNASFVNRLKLRASYGEVGNDDLLDFYISQPRYSLTSNAGTPAIFWSDIGSSTLTWETVESWDVALEFNLFNNIIDGTVEYYRKNSSDLLYNLPIALSNGLNEKPENIGTMYNEGFEIGVTANIIRKDNFYWSLRAQASTLKNEITELPSPFVSGSKRWDEGRSRYDFYLYHYAGVDPDNGDALYFMFDDDPVTGERVAVLDDDDNHATTNDWDDAGRAYTGDQSVPDLIGSLQNSLSYRNFALDFLFTFSSGGKVLDNGYSTMMHTGTYGRSFHKDILNAWREPGDQTSVPRLENGSVNQVQTQSTRFLTDASYISLKNVNLSYTFDESILGKIGVDLLRVFVSGENLFITTERTGLNPQYNLSGTPGGNDYNPSRILSFGLNLSF